MQNDVLVIPLRWGRPRSVNKPSQLDSSQSGLLGWNCTLVCPWGPVRRGQMSVCTPTHKGKFLNHHLEWIEGHLLSGEK